MCYFSKSTFLIFLMLQISNIFSEANEVSDAFIKSKIVPEILKKAPEQLLSVEYSTVSVHLGTNVTSSQVSSEPEIHWNGSFDCYYLLAMSGPGVLNAVTNEVNHWLVGNIKGDDVNSGDVMASYLTPVPPPGTAFHRYRFFVYQQPQCEKVTYNEAIILNEILITRLGFHLTDFVQKYNLGDPMWGNFMCSYSDVDTINPAAGAIRSMSQEMKLNI